MVNASLKVILRLTLRLVNCPFLVFKNSNAKIIILILTLILKPLKPAFIKLLATELFFF